MRHRQLITVIDQVSCEYNCFLLLCQAYHSACCFGLTGCIPHILYSAAGHGKSGADVLTPSAGLAE